MNARNEHLKIFLSYAELHFHSHSLKSEEEMGLTEFQGLGEVSLRIRTKGLNLKLVMLRIRGFFGEGLALKFWETQEKEEEEEKRARRRRDGSYDESRHVFALKRVFLGSERAAARRRLLNSDATCLSATGGNALINTDCPSLSPGQSVSLMIVGATPPPPLPKEPNWLMSGSPCYFHIDTSIDDSASAAGCIDQPEGDRFQTAANMYFWTFMVKSAMLGVKGSVNLRATCFHHENNLIIYAKKQQHRDLAETAEYKRELLDCFHLNNHVSKVGIF